MTSLTLFRHNCAKTKSAYSDLWWPGYWPDLKMFCVKKLVHVRTYPTPFTVCRYDA